MQPPPKTGDGPGATALTCPRGSRVAQRTCQGGVYLNIFPWGAQLLELPSVPSTLPNGREDARRLGIKPSVRPSPAGYPDLSAPRAGWGGREQEGLNIFPVWLR